MTRFARLGVIVVAGVAVGVLGLTLLRAPVIGPAASPSPSDSANLASSITRVDDEVLRFRPQSEGHGDLIAVHPGTGDVRVLVEGLEDVDTAGWSSDGRWLAYENVRGPLWVIGSDQRPRQVGDPGSEWAWSPTGARLSLLDGGLLSVFDPATGQLAALGSTDWTPVWSPDGTRLVLGERGGSIFSIDARSGERSLLARLPGAGLDSVDGIEWSPDGTRLAIFNDIIPGFGRLYILNADGSGVRVIAEDAAVEGLDWSPDGARITFAESTDAEMRVWVAPADGAKPVLLGSQPHQGSGGDPVWSPDGSRIAFWTEPGVAFVIDADGSGAVAPLDALTYERWRGGWFACSTCVIDVRRF